jgi:hypothetical protein
MNADVFLARLSGVRRSGTGWIARCPAHKDRSPSLSVGEGRGGRVLVHCFAGCTAEAICAAIGISVSELFAGPGEPRKPEPPIVRAVERQIAGLRSRLTPRERDWPVVVVIANRTNLDTAIARALALAVEGELVQVVLAEGGQ